MKYKVGEKVKFITNGTIDGQLVTGTVIGARKVLFGHLYIIEYDVNHIRFSGEVTHRTTHVCSRWERKIYKDRV